MNFQPSKPPWRIVKRPGRNGPRTVIEAGEDFEIVEVAEINTAGDMGREGAANAVRIVNAANAHDDLVAACKTALRTLSELDVINNNDGTFDRECDALVAALKKAQGDA